MRSRRVKTNPNQMEIGFSPSGAPGVQTDPALTRTALPEAFRNSSPGVILPSQVVYQDCASFPMRPAEAGAVGTPAGLKKRYLTGCFNPDSLDADRFSYQAGTYVRCLESRNNVLVWGDPGSGKTHLAITCCGQALSTGSRVIVFNPSAAAFHEQAPKAVKITGLRSDG